MEVRHHAVVLGRVYFTLRTLNLCLLQVCMTKFRIDVLRCVDVGCTLLWRSPLVFTFPHLAHTKHVMVTFFFQGEEFAAWWLIEDDDPDLVQKEDLLRCLADDQVAGVVFSELLIRLYLGSWSRHYLGIHSGLSDNASGRLLMPGCCGSVRAYSALVETQGRGGLHMHVIKDSCVAGFSTGLGIEVSARRTMMQWWRIFAVSLLQFWRLSDATLCLSKSLAGVGSKTLIHSHTL